MMYEKRTLPEIFEMYLRNKRSWHPACHMTLRDYFAGQALAGLVVCFHEAGEIIPEATSEFCYELADAMLAERDQEQP
jgi:hypothetical protein